MKVAVIPARGGSKRIPRKNIKLFHGEPMISYAILAAQATGIFDKIVVSTDDDEIRAISEFYGAVVPFRRPAELSDDYTPTVPVIAHAIKTCLLQDWNIKHVCCIYPAVPFISPHDLVRAYSQLVTTSATYVFPVTKFPSPIQRAFRRFPDNSIKPFFPENALVRTQDLEPAYFDAGQFYWGELGAWLNELNIHLHGHTIEVPEWRVVDVDTIDDWARAEALYQAHFK